MKHLRYLDKYLIKYKWRLLLGIVFVALSNYFRAWQPQVIRDALDHVLAQVKLFNSSTPDQQEQLYREIGRALLEFGGLVLLLAVAMGIFMYFMRQTIIVMSRLIEYDLRKEIFEHYERLDLSFFRRNKTGDLMARITEDVSKVRMYLGPAMLYGINLTTLFVMVIYSMFKVNVELSLYTLLPLPFLSISIYYVSNIIHKKSAVIQKQLSRLNSIAQEVYSGIRVVKSYGREKQFGRFFADESEDYKVKTLELARVNALFFPLMLVLIGASTILVIYVGGIQVSKGNVTPGNIAEFVIYVNMLTWPVTSIGWIASLIQQAEASQMRINEFLQTEPGIQNPATAPRSLGGHIVFDHVTFIYPETGIKAIDDISFEIMPGERVAIVGKMAAGKTTIADLLLRMYDVTSGRIMMDGEDVRDLNLDTLRYQIGYVPQDVFLFSNTVEQNILFGSKDLDASKAMEYARYASVHEDIMQFPKGYQTMVGERGVTLSGGQKQRVSIARAFVKEPDILILDDCLSAVDTKTEQRILQYLNGALSGKTAIVITHRMMGGMEFDKILVLQEGKIVERGKHDELMQLGGVYYDLVKRQAIEDQYAL